MAYSSRSVAGDGEGDGDVDCGGLPATAVVLAIRDKTNKTNKYIVIYNLYIIVG